jgi:formamidopyrimidine-DNA glycosylase
MPELPEVETTRIGIAPHILGETVKDVIVRNNKLRWTVSKFLRKKLIGQSICKLSRRAKYLIFHTEHGCMLLHLGMSGSLRILTSERPPEKHDHVDIVFQSNTCLRFRDPRRFGSIHWTSNDPLQHKLLYHLGPEPFSDDLDGDYLFSKSRNRILSIKNFIMDSHVVVGIGNIYANEVLFAAGINPKNKAGKITKVRYAKLAQVIKDVLQQSLAKGGTTLRDFVNSKGEPGYFRLELKVYDRAGKPCPNCNTSIKVYRLGQRSTFYCTRCQH